MEEDSLMTDKTVTQAGQDDTFMYEASSKSQTGRAGGGVAGENRDKTVLVVG